MKINCYSLLEGAKKARGCVVIIDVFRAFSMEAYCLNEGASFCVPIKTIEECLELKKKYPDAILAGEREGIKIEGFDIGNSPTDVLKTDLKGKIILHTTSSGTQGINAAIPNAECIIGGSLVTAKAIAKYIKQNKFEEVSLVAMGYCYNKTSSEDELCARYIKSLLEGKDEDINKEALEIKNNYDGERFFTKTDVFPTSDFYYCTDINKFNFVLVLDKTDDIYIMKKVEV